MKKKVLSALLVAAMTTTMFAGCGASSDAGSSAQDSTAAASDAEVETKDVSLTVMGPSEDLDEASGAWLQTECDAFNEAHPEWNITFDYVTCSESDAKDTVLQDPAAAADVYLFANDQLVDLIDAGAISKLGGTTADYVTSTNSDAVVASVSYNGDVYAVPYTSNTWFMYYDKRVFSEEDVKSLDTMLTKGKVSFPLTNAWYNVAFFAATGCTFYGDGSDEDGVIDYDGDKAVDATKYIVNLVANENFVADNSDGSLGLAGLADGSVNAYFNGNWNYDAVVEALGEENVGVASLPTISVNGENCQMRAFLGSKAIAVNPNCEDQDVAVALAAFLGSEQSQLDHFTLRGQAPVNTNLAADETIATDPVAAAMAEVAANASICQPIFGMENYWTAGESFGEACLPGAEDQVTLENAAEKTAELNEQMNGSLVD